MSIYDSVKYMKNRMHYAYTAVYENICMKMVDSKLALLVLLTINVPLFKKMRDIIFFCGTITF